LTKGDPVPKITASFPTREGGYGSNDLEVKCMGPVAIAIAFVILDISFALVKKRSGKD
jgi:hypothetical protein